MVGEYATVKGVKIPVTRIENDTNGNPRYIIHWLALGLSDYAATKETRRAGLTKYHGRSYGGGFVFQSYNLDRSVEYILDVMDYDPRYAAYGEPVITTKRISFAGDEDTTVYRKFSYMGNDVIHAVYISEKYGIEVLQSYDTNVCYYDKHTKRFVRLWDGWSLTTSRQINGFRQHHGLPALTKSEWNALPVEG